jgi:hypothetical protein
MNDVTSLIIDASLRQLRNKARAHPCSIVRSLNVSIVKHIYIIKVDRYVLQALMSQSQPLQDNNDCRVIPTKH